MSSKYTPSSKASSTTSEITALSVESSTLPASIQSRMRYAKDGRGYHFSASYKYGKQNIESNSAQLKDFTRGVYEKDARGVELNYSGFQVTNPVDAPSPRPRQPSIVGDDGLFRNPYDVGQRVRSLGYWAELRASMNGK